jgi:prephenate dehydrogenase
MNRDVVLPELAALHEPLAELERALQSGDADAVARWLEKGSQWRRSVEG